MRIICDHCGEPVAGTVKRVAGNLNLHPDCLAQLGEETKLELTAVSSRSGKLSDTQFFGFPSRRVEIAALDPLVFLREIRG
ncbi:MAG TPA: hypothetical protein VJS64_16575 [Pyrinomonadaceae bacterium]|nr:hypothetical protein [Pyrinomonadaceae bacterium]